MNLVGGFPSCFLPPLPLDSQCQLISRRDIKLFNSLQMRASRGIYFECTKPTVPYATQPLAMAFSNGKEVAELTRRDIEATKNIVLPPIFEISNEIYGMQH